MMKKYYFILITILLGLQTTGYGQIVEHFKAYDYADEITIDGSKGVENIYIPVNENIDVLNSYINLEFTCSSVLNFDQSYISILLADTPVETRFLKNQSQIVSFKIPVKEKHIVSGFIKLTLKTNLRIGDEICEINSEGGFWVTLTDNSFFSYNLLPSKKTVVEKTISYTIPDLKYIVLSKENDIVNIQNASYIKFYLKRVYGLELEIKNIEDFNESVINNAIVLMPFDKLSDKILKQLPDFKNEDAGLISVFKDEYKDPETLEIYSGQNIVVTGKTDLGFNKAANIMLQKHLLNSSYVDYVFVNKQTKLLDIPERKDYDPIYFEELDAQNGVLEGIGYLRSNISIPRAKFGSNVKKMNVNIKGKYRPLDDKEQGYFNIYFNDNFLSSYKLDNTGELNINFDFDDIVMEQDNNFKYEFYFIPRGGLCQIAPANFYGQIDNINSYFKPVGYDVSSTLSFFRFPENFQSKPLAIYTDLGAEDKLVGTLSELIDIINPGEAGLSGFIYPQIKAANLNAIKADLETSKIIISANSDMFSDFYGDASFIKFKDNTVQYDSEEFSPLLEEFSLFFNLEYQKEMGFNQLFYYNDSPVMLINVPQDYKESTLSSLVSNIREQTISNTGNVIVAENDDAYFFDLRVIKNNQDKTELSSMLNEFWGKYRLFIVSVLLILAILVLMFMYQKSKESKAKIQNEN